ncbi:hypothetical protein [Okeania sp. KiyG1]|uniref:hypothetical protein n=1 Tax=Okeania sp. KiyG1 TaxID=2720165 RepID=UPI0019226B41|nr:hypothetical protein [Okeania sp. KiyG1]GGA54243.1 hypothetical protein CYANOKiyG1_74500 [Okeania sp. KiyG1]
MTIATFATEVEVTPPTLSASQNELAIATSATEVELIIESSAPSASQNEMTIAASATKVEVTPPTLSASQNEMTIATSATEVEVTPQLRVLHRMK